MKFDQPARRCEPKISLRSQVFTLIDEKNHLGRLVQKAGRGDPVYIVAGHRRFVLQEVPEIEPIPQRPPGYFAAAYSRAEVQEDNYLAKASVVCVPKARE